jgi:NAD(P)-dependent dehydrogenase (short-subunit alcohol dehydrogenase family)
MRQLEGKVAWVTGGGSGIGEAAALLLAGEGATVVLSGRRAERLDAVARRITDAGGAAHVQPGDLGDPATSAATGAVIADKLGRLDLLVNNAGLNIPDRTWAVLTPERIDEMIAANLKAPFYCATIALPLMRARKSGLLIHISSIDGLQVSKFSGASYAASKHGVVALSHSINLEEARNGIRSCVICPGGVDTEILSKRIEPPTEEQRSRLLRPGDVADLIRYVACLPPTIRIDQVTMTPALAR